MWNGRDGCSFDFAFNQYLLTLVLNIFVGGARQNGHSCAFVGGDSQRLFEENAMAAIDRRDDQKQKERNRDRGFNGRNARPSALY